MSRKALLSLLGLLIPGLTILYYYLGGFNQVDYAVKEVNGEYSIIGRKFEGKYNAHELEKIFTTVRKLIKNGQIRGTMVIINYNDSYDEYDGTVKYTVGILVDNEGYAVPEGFEIINIKASKVVRATINAHNVVMPAPAKILKGAGRMAMQHNLTLSNYSIEQYRDERQLVIDFPVR
ncbi:MAG: GyrI-like domain-containing protein [Bacteroidetes bacterium]|nr:GyrI-like domain-containing protein [Bacteroidota bacterium]MCH8233079.1 GyrI-like domain-containing protein [Bacteroidota bacterium]